MIKIPTTEIANTEPYEQLAERDRQLIWHPYTQMQTADLPIPIAAAKGAILKTTEGKEIIDAVSSWWVNIHGHAHPHIAEQVYKQMCTLEHVIFAGYTHLPAVRLCERLQAILPSNQKRFFFSDNGSTAIEVALKMVFQYYYNKSGQHNKRHKIIALEHAYHGDTFGAMSVSGRSTFTAAFNKYLFDVVYIESPALQDIEVCKQQLSSYIAQGDVAAFIYEPLVQGAGGMLMYSPESLSSLMAICKDNEVFCIADEVMTGFGRTSTLFASEQASYQPDIMCLSKGLTGGALPMSLTTCTNKIYEAFLSNDPLKTFFHGHSYTANATACAAALASLDILLTSQCAEQRQYIAQQHVLFKEKVQQHPRVAEVRKQGTILALEIKQATDNEATGYHHSIREEMYNFCLSKGVLLRPLGNVLYILPPYCISPQELQKVYAVITDFLAQL